MKIGLVLEGGGMWGLHTAGVLDVMMEQHFMPDVVCGTSADVTFGVNLLSQQRRQRLCRWQKIKISYLDLHIRIFCCTFAAENHKLI